MLFMSRNVWMVWIVKNIRPFLFMCKSWEKVIMNGGVCFIFPERKYKTPCRLRGADFLQSGSDWHYYYYWEGPLYDAEFLLCEIPSRSLSSPRLLMHNRKKSWMSKISANYIGKNLFRTEGSSLLHLGTVILILAWVFGRYYISWPITPLCIVLFRLCLSFGVRHLFFALRLSIPDRFPN